MYVKIFSSLLDSSIMLHDLETRYVWICLLMLADDQGFIDMTAHAIARRIDLTEEAVNKAIQEFLQPDPLSRSQDFEGRRLEPIRESFGWKILNYTFYRETERKRQRQEYMKEYMAKNRALKNQPLTENVNSCKLSVNNVSRQAEAEAEAEAEAIKTPSKIEHTEFNTFWGLYPKKVGKKNSLNIWLKLCPDLQLVEKIMSALEKDKSSKQWQDEQYIPHPERWLKREPWNDNLEASTSEPAPVYNL